MKAGLKMGVGFFVVATVLGIRVVSVTPEADISRNSGDPSAADTLPVQPIAVAVDREDRAANAKESSMGTASTGVRDRLSGSGAAETRDGDRMVSCRLRGATQFMTADDCAMRGGQSTLFEADR